MNTSGGSDANGIVMHADVSTTLTRMPSTYRPALKSMDSKFKAAFTSFPRRVRLWAPSAWPPHALPP